MSQTDAILTLLLGVGLFQFAWLSVMLHRRGIKAERILSSIPPLFAIWVLFWPVYTHAETILLGICLLALCISLASTIRHPLFSTLKSCWSGQAHGLLDVSMFMLALGLAALAYLEAPEFGFGMALALCMGVPAADLLDRTRVVPLDFPSNPGQTLIGHLVLILVITLLGGWSLLIFHDLDWSHLFMATALAGMVASTARAMMPEPLNQPLIVLAMGLTLWLL